MQSQKKVPLSHRIAKFKDGSNQICILDFNISSRTDNCLSDVVKLLEIEPQGLISSLAISEEVAKLFNSEN